MPARNVTFGLIEVVAALVPFGTPSHRGECGWGVANLIKRLCFRAPRCFSGRKQAANPVVHRLRCIWLWERVSVTQFLRSIDGTQYGACQNHVQTSAMLANPFCQSKPVHRAWHLNVTENYVNIGFLVQENCQCFVAIRSFNNPVSAISKILGNRHADQDVVLNDQDDFLGDVHAVLGTERGCSILMPSMSSLTCRTRPGTS